MPVFKGTKSFYDYEVSDTLAYNLKSWIDYGLLETGAYTIVSFGNAATSGYTNLKRTYDDRYDGHGRVYEGMGPSWVWEQDVYPVTNDIPRPLVASGIRVNNTFYPANTDSGPYAHTMDFRHGRVIFKSPVPDNTKVECEYTFRDVATYLVDDPEWKIIVDGHTEKFESLQLHSPSGMAQFLKESRVWLPSVVIEVGNRLNSALQLGGGDINEFDVNYHIFADNPFVNRRLADLLNNQYQHQMCLLNINTAQFPFTYEGALASGALTYPKLAIRESPYFYTYGYISETSGGPQGSSTDVYRAEVSHTISVDRYMSTF